MRVVLYSLAAALLLFNSFVSADTIQNGIIPVAADSTKSLHAACPSKATKRIVKKPIRPEIVPYVYSAMLYQGSLRHNVIRIAHKYGWDTVIWNPPEDYLWSGNARITGNSLSEIFNKMLARYPLQAQFYNGNHVLAIVPRNLP